MAVVPDTLDLVVGEQRSFELQGLGTAGYIWQDVVEGPPEVVEATWARGFAEGTAVQAVGASAPETVTIRATQPGDVVVRLVQRRPWETDVEPTGKHEIAVHVEPSTS